MNRKNGCPLIVPEREPLEYNERRVTCTERGGLCENYANPGHGFICWFEDGTCLKTETRKYAKGGASMAKTQNTRIFDRFTEYSVADCDCRYFHYGEKNTATSSANALLFALHSDR